MKYIKIEFTSGLFCIAYQEIDDCGEVINIKDESGNILDLSDIVTESKVIDDNPEPLEWFL